MLSVFVLTLPCALWAASPLAEQWLAHVRILASDDMQGRAPGTPGYRKAAEYVADQLKQAGVKPFFGNSYLQAVGLRSRRVLREGTSVTLIRDGGAQQQLAISDDYGLNASNELPPSVEAPLAFIGYGNYLPEAKLNDTAGIDLKGKIVVYIQGAPSGTSTVARAHAAASLNRRPALAKAGAIGYIAIPDPANSDLPWDRAAPAYFQPAMNLTDAALDTSKVLRFGMTINPAKAATLFEGSQRKFTDLMRLVELGKPLPHFQLPLKLRAAIRTEIRELTSENVAGVIPGTEPVFNGEYALITAHLDHLGVADPVNGDAIYNGAMDNASGVATLIEIAKNIQARHTRRNVIVAAVTAEEEGLLGSQYLAAHDNLPRGGIISNLNIDMFLPLYPVQSIIAYGMGESSIRAQLEAVTKRSGIRFDDDPQPKRNLFIRSDQYSFIRAGIPSVSLDIGYRSSAEEKLQKKWLDERYHAPSDDINQPMDVEAAARFTEIATAVTREMGNSGIRPHWNGDSFFKRFEIK